MSTRKLINRTKNTLCKLLQRACRLLSTAAYVGTSMWLVMKPVGAHRPTCETPPPSISLTSEAVPRKKTCGKAKV